MEKSSKLRASSSSMKERKMRGQRTSGNLLMAPRHCAKPKQIFVSPEQIERKCGARLPKYEEDTTLEQREKHS